MTFLIALLSFRSLIQQCSETGVWGHSTGIQVAGFIYRYECARWLQHNGKASRELRREQFKRVADLIHPGCGIPLRRKRSRNRIDTPGHTFGNEAVGKIEGRRLLSDGEVKVQDLKENCLQVLIEEVHFRACDRVVSREHCRCVSYADCLRIEWPACCHPKSMLFDYRRSSELRH